MAKIPTDRRLIIILGDQLDLSCVLPDDYCPGQDQLWMCEAAGEARRAWSHKARLVYFLAAMRHFRAATLAAGHQLHYRDTAAARDEPSLTTWLARDLQQLKPASVVLTRPGDFDLLEEIRAACSAAKVPLELREDPHFYLAPEEFANWAQGRKQMRMEHFYRHLRRTESVLLDTDGQPQGGQWNFDADNRRSFGASGPPPHDAPHAFEPDALTAEVIALVESEYADHPGDCASFDWPVTPEQAQQALSDFIQQRLPVFGDYQDAIWVGEPWLFHSRIAAALNLHLLKPREVIAAACAALDAGHAPLNAVEGFVRQILGWREFVRGLYWLHMPDWRTQNALQAEQPLPDFFWTGETDLACLRDALHSTLRYGYAHHIQRLMITGLFCLLLGVRPREVEAWYHAVYVDAVSWVELPNTLGMSQYADGGWLASKPYIASGAYIQRMSNACSQCRYKPTVKTGPRACPYTTLYWDFLDRHRERFANHPRLRMQLRNLERLDDTALEAIRTSAQTLRQRWASPPD